MLRRRKRTTKRNHPTRSCDRMAVHEAHDYEATASHQEVSRPWSCPGRRIMRGNGHNTFDALEAGVYPFEELMASPSCFGEVPADV